MSFYIYMVKCANGQFYTGWSTDPLRRLRQHNNGKGSRFTRMNAPCQLVYAEEMPDKSTALKREIRVKQLTHLQKAKLIENETLNCLSCLDPETTLLETKPKDDLLHPSVADHQQNNPESYQSQDPQG